MNATPPVPGAAVFVGVTTARMRKPAGVAAYKSRSVVMVISNGAKSSATAFTMEVMEAGVSLEGAATIVLPPFQLGSVMLAPAKSTKMTPLDPGRVLSNGMSVRTTGATVVTVPVVKDPEAVATLPNSGAAADSLPEQTSEAKRRSTRISSSPSCAIWYPTPKVGRKITPATSSMLEANWKVPVRSVSSPAIRTQPLSDTTRFTEPSTKSPNAVGKAILAPVFTTDHWRAAAASSLTIRPLSESEFTPAFARNGTPIGAACTDKSRGSESSEPAFDGLLEA